ncbi:RagB/SusD family nutrient uptake outer membrane protein [Pararcticibacter amylolyticus]|uniref:RagB/SusD family nutrient uptake outer membrane protein n=1 Tax=Pararcticibacter amylolyticus TaxID=2173175 RepID=A0A2U2PH45_9SPHI|nr:RagB/SusD family nutrient uptake outer membrane protein [Pararcticibacter amylolyticus]PWG80594.1 RagB/SusD family nutrient uptake outer membrane protein [Pararcticibacter amylolyticus]
MNKIFQRALLLLSIITISSCKDWLDNPSPTQLDSETVFKDLNAADKAVLGAYASSFHQELFYNLAANSDETISTENNNSKTRLANFDYVPIESPSGLYTTAYQTIEYANNVLKKLPLYEAANAAEEKKKNMLLGESYTLRAMSYLNVVRFFGDMPYTDIPLEDAQSFAAGRTDRDVIYDHCISDLQKAVELLPWYEEGMIPTPERISKNAAYGILARTALYAAGYSLRWDLNTYSASSLRLAQRADQARVRELYSIAADACAAVVNRGYNQLLPKYEDVFRDLVNGRYNKESMLEFGQWGTNVNSTGIGYSNGIAVLRGNTLFGRSFPVQGAMPTFWFDFDVNDTRRGVTIANYGLNEKSERLMNPYSMHGIGKFRVVWKNDKGVADNKRNINWIQLRYSDVLLMYAESLNELHNGPTADAVKAIRDVRKRALGGNESKIGTIPTDYQGFKDAIIEERKLELAFEGWRKTDLIRWGISFEKLTETKANLIALARREGKYANVPRFAAYKIQVATFSDPLVQIDPSYTYMTEPDATEKARLTAGGYKLVNMDGDVVNSGATRFDFIDRSNNQLAAWVSNLFSGMQKNKSELLPLGSGKIDLNPGFAGQELPGY